MKIEHIGIATRALEETAGLWQQILGLKLEHTEEVPDQKVKVAMLPIGESQIELLEATRADSPIAKFIEKRGPGIHHIAIRVDDIHAELRKLKERGARLIDETPRVGIRASHVAFLHPASTGGVLTEIVQPAGVHA